MEHFTKTSPLQQDQHECSSHENKMTHSAHRNVRDGHITVYLGKGIDISLFNKNPDNFFTFRLRRLVVHEVIHRGVVLQPVTKRG